MTKHIAVYVRVSSNLQDTKSQEPEPATVGGRPRPAGQVVSGQSDRQNDGSARVAQVGGGHSPWARSPQWSSGELTALAAPQRA